VDIGNNILLLAGIVGAGISLFLLLIGLCYARKVHHASTSSNEGGGEGESRNNTKKNKSTTATINSSTNAANELVTFEPGKNNPGSRKHRTSWFRRSCSINSNSSSNKNTSLSSGSPLRPPPPPPFPPTNTTTTSSRTNTPNDYHTDDDESHADFVLARAALGKKNSSTNDGGGGGEESLEDGDMESLGESLGYTTVGDGESLAPRTATKYINGVNAIPGITTTDEDSAIGAGGISSFTNDRGIFRWNENGTKMVYTPTTTTTSTTTVQEQNGFIFDEYNKKWVVKDKIIGGKGTKNVSFPAAESTTLALLNTTTVESLEHLKRVRSNESGGGSVISGMTGMSEFTYDQIGCTNNNTNTTNDNNSRKVIMTKKTKKGTASRSSPTTPDNETGEEGFEISSSMGITLTPLTPATVYDDTSNDNDTIDDIDQLLLRVGPATLSTPSRNILRPGSSNNNNDIVDDGSTSMMTGFTDVYESSSMTTTNIVTPERSNNGNRYNNNNNNTDDCGSSVQTGDPGRIVPKSKTKLEPPQHPSSSSDFGGGAMFFGGVGRRSVILPTHAHHASPSMLKIVSEDMPFDEDIPFDERSKIIIHSNNSMNDEDDDSSQGSVNSEHVLKDLDSLSKFMYERKRSEKMKKSRGQQQRGGGGGTSRGGGGGGWDDSKTSSARFGGAVGRTTTRR
jgi:hypothetical protein